MLVGLTYKGDHHHLFITDQTLTKLKKNSESGSRRCSICAKKFRTASAKKHIATSHRKTHEQQHYALKMCGCLKYFASDDSVRKHRRRSVGQMRRVGESFLPECPDATEREVGCPDYPVTYIVDAESADQCIRYVRSKSNVALTSYPFPRSRKPGGILVAGTTRPRRR